MKASPQLFSVGDEDCNVDMLSIVFCKRRGYCSSIVGCYGRGGGIV
jgi:hypothetical protein